MKTTQWYIAKKKTAERWVAYEERPSLRCGYEMKGPYKTLVGCLMAAAGWSPNNRRTGQ